jgi:hypothetical protein
VFNQKSVGGSKQIMELKVFVFKMKGEPNVNLKAITTKMNLSSPLRHNKARECYAKTLSRAKRSIDKIGEATGHTTITVTRNHYIGDMNIEEMSELNDALF